VGVPDDKSEEAQQNERADHDGEAVDDDGKGKLKQHVRVAETSFKELAGEAR
jgi:hypothetical protein